MCICKECYFSQAVLTSHESVGFVLELLNATSEGCGDGYQSV